VAKGSCEPQTQREKEMENQETEIRIYAACLAAYNSSMAFETGFEEVHVFWSH